MARIRSLKPEIWMSPQIMNVEHSTRLLFIGLITQADDEGRGTADPRRLKASIFGGDDVTSSNVRRWLDELAAQALIILYETASHGLLYELPSWRSHQKIDRAKKSTYPPPDHGLPPGAKAEAIDDQSSIDQRRVVGDRIGSEGSDRKDRIGRIGSDQEPSPPSTADAVEGADAPLPRGRKANGTNPRATGTNPRALGTNPRAQRNQSLEAWRSVTAPIEYVAATGTLPAPQRLTWLHVREQLQEDQMALAAIEALGDGDFGHGCRLIADRDRFTQADLEARFRAAYERVTGQAS
jgi:hypothetical protein